MEKNEKEFSPQESLQVIRAMIDTTRNSFGDSSPYFLLWGWAVMIACLVQFVLLSINYPNDFISWLFIIPVTVVIHFIMLARMAKKEKVKTFVGEASGYLWTALGLCFSAFPFIFAKIGWQYCLPFYILIYGVGTFVTGKLINFKPLIWGGIGCFILAIITPYLDYKYQLLLAAFSLLISYIIPGHLLKAFNRKSKS